MLVLQVMDYVGVTHIPERHILKRWTGDFRNVLPEHLRHYQRDQSKGKEVTYRHCNLYILAVELVRIWESSTEAYEEAVPLFKENLVVLAPFEKMLEMDLVSRIELLGLLEREQKFLLSVLQMAVAQMAIR